MTGLASVPSNGNTSLASLAALSDRLITVFGVKETEQNWQEMEDILKTMTAAINDSVGRGELQEIAWRIQNPLTACLQTERTRLALSAMDLVLSLSNHLRDSFEQLHDVYMPPLLRLAERTNKIFHNKAQSTLTAITTNDPHRGCRYYLSKIADSLQSANKTLRQCAADMLLTVAKLNKRGGGGVGGEEELFMVVMDLTAKCLSDALPTVRQTGRLVFAELDEEQRGELAGRLPVHVLKTLGLAPVASAVTSTRPTDLMKSQTESIVNSSCVNSVVATPNKFVDLLSSAKSAARLPADTHSSRLPADTHSNHELHSRPHDNHSRLPIGPAKRHTHNTTTGQVSKTAARVIKNVFEVNAEDLVLDVPVTAISVNSDYTSVCNQDKQQQQVKLNDLHTIKEWNKRAEHVEAIRRTIASFETANKQQHFKLWETAISAVGDVHFRVIEAGLRLSGDLLTTTWMSETTEKRQCVEEVLVRAASAVLANRSRKSVIDAVDRLMWSVNEVVGGERLLSTHYPSLMSRLDVLGSPRLKAQLLRLFESTVRCCLQRDGRQRLAELISRGALLSRVCGGLTDSEQSLAQASRAFLLVTVAAIGRRLGEECLLPAIRSPAARALLTALMDANASLLPRSPRHRSLPEDDEIMIEQHIPINPPHPTPTKSLNTIVDQLADQLCKTPIK